MMSVKVNEGVPPFELDSQNKGALEKLERANKNGSAKIKRAASILKLDSRLSGSGTKENFQRRKTAKQIAAKRREVRESTTRRESTNTKSNKANSSRSAFTKKKANNTRKK